MTNKCKAMVKMGLIIGVWLLVFPPSSSYGAVPQLINYQGVLTDSDGIPIEGPVDMIFSIYATSTGRIELWYETHNSVMVIGGVFSGIATIAQAAQSEASFR